MAVLVANAKNIQRILKFTPLAARELVDDLKEARQAEIDLVFDGVSKAMGGHGTSVIQGPHFRRWYWADIVLLYVNMGDPYTNTIMYEPRVDKFYVGGWGDWVEWKGKKYDLE